MDNAEPTRYRVAPIEYQMTYGGGVLQSDPSGPIISYVDYARLKAEVHRLEEIVGSDVIDRKYGMCCDASDEVARLKAEVDQMATILSDLLQSDLIACSISRGVIKSTLAKWNADTK
jgi:hypothetical protein